MELHSWAGGRWAQRLGWSLAAIVSLAVLAFYASRLFMPLPIFAGDEAAYLIRAIYPDNMVAADPFVAEVVNGVHLSVIRAVYDVGAPIVVGDRLVNAAAYMGGLLLLWRFAVRGLPTAEQGAFVLIALGFPYYRFAFSDLAEGLFVGVLALLCVATGRWYRSRPTVHAVAAGALAAALVLVKPNGLAAVVALGALAAIEAAASGDWRRLPVRAGLFAAAFFGVGNVIQWAAEQPSAHPLAFFVGQYYDRVLTMKPPPDRLAIGGLALGSMVSAMAVLTGAPAVVGLTDLVGRWRGLRERFALEPADLVFLLLLMSAAATLAMVTIFAIHLAWTPSETKRLWGRYFEFFAPMLWLAAAPALGRPISRRTALGCAAAMLAGLAGLLASFHAGIVLFPWDASALSAFFSPDAVRAPMVGFRTPFRALAAAATVLAAAALALRVRPAAAGVGLIVVLGVLSTLLDHGWTGPIVAQRNALERDVRVIRRILPARGEIVLLAPDANEGHLGFLRLDARPLVYLGPPGAQAPAAALAGVSAVVVSGPGTPPGGPWARTFRGEDLSLFLPAP